MFRRHVPGYREGTPVEPRPASCDGGVQLIAVRRVNHRQIGISVSHPGKGDAPGIKTGGKIAGPVHRIQNPRGWSRRCVCCVCIARSVAGSTVAGFLSQYGIAGKAPASFPSASVPTSGSSAHVVLRSPRFR
jgi:hypothetical protein